MKYNFKNLKNNGSSSPESLIEGELMEQRRCLPEILEKIDEFSDRIWYDRKLVMKANIEDGLEEKPSPELMKQIRKAMKSVEKKYGGKDAVRNYYHTDFEWGMMNGKLSALRWVLGDEWDNLYT